MSGELFGPIFVPDAFREAVSGRAWLQAMLDAEAALAVAGTRVGLIPPGDAQTIAGCCAADLFDAGEIGRGGRPAGNPVPALARALTEEVAKASPAAARHVHRGATSQDITDTAAMLVSRRALDLILTEVDGIADACARLAREHRDTPMAGRTLLQQALPTTFGLKAAGWLVPVLEARRRLRELRALGLAVQLGGAAGTLASLGDLGPSVLREFALELGLPEPPLPWHTDRTRISNIAEALSLLAGVLGKISEDIILMAQTEVGEVPHAAGVGGGGNGEDGVAFVGEGRGAAAALAGGLGHLADLGLGHEDHVPGDLREDARQERERRADVRDPRPVRVPGHGRLREAELQRELPQYGESRVPERG